MRIVILSDLQCNNWEEFSKILPNGMNSRFQDQLDVLDEIFSFTINSGCEIIIHDGDLFETQKEEINKVLYLTVFERFVEFSKHGIIVILNVGNHDQIGKFGEDNVLKPFKEINNVLVMDRPTVESLSDIDLAFVPYTIQNFKSAVRNLIGLLPIRSGRKSYLFTHQGVSGAKVGPRDELLREEYRISDFYPDSWARIFNGHYHKHQDIGKIQVIGSPIQRDFGERNDVKGFCVLDTEKDSLDFINCMSGPRFFKIDGGEFKIPKDFRKDKDFLWYKSTKKPQNLPDNIQLRLDIVEEEGYQTRSDISISLPVKNQMEKYIEFVNPELDKTKLLEKGLDKYRRAVV